MEGSMTPPTTDKKLDWALWYASELNVPVFLFETDGEDCGTVEEAVTEDSGGPS